MKTPASNGRDSQTRSSAADAAEASFSLHPDEEHVYRKVRIFIGEVRASAEPLLLQTLLGSCVAVCLRDPESRIGGMNHILIPGSCHNDQLPSRFGVHAMELLINQIMRLGGDRRKLVAKAFGAANVVPSLQAPTVGDHNAIFVRAFLAAESIPLVAQRLGGTHAVQVHFRTDTGKVIVHSVDGSRLPAILLAEDDFVAHGSASRMAAAETTYFNEDQRSL
jgi:chemotaxis receptor (MCP) glutamine deamidase CheD